MEHSSGPVKEPFSKQVMTCAENKQSAESRVYQRYVNTSRQWINDLIQQRINELTNNTPGKSTLHIPKTVFDEANPVKAIMDNINGDVADFTLLSLALCSKIYEKHLQPLISLQEKHPDIGGVIRRINFEFVPTVKTAAFLINGNDDNTFPDSYAKIVHSLLIKEEIVELINTDQQTDVKNAIIRLNDKYLQYITHGKSPDLVLTPDFPAQLLKTSKTFDELILKDTTRQQLEDAILFAQHQKELLEDHHLTNKLSPGFISLFWGPPGTGKSLTASVIGNELGLEAYRIDLSRVVSKYIGETEKNLEKVFQRFDGKNCILFFDEADALFGKRSDVKEAKDRYANQEISYLLQRIETFGGLVILASNLKENMDEAFKRRVLSWVHFPRPTAEERYKLWQIHLPESFSFASEELLSWLAASYELTGSHISNVIKLSCIRALGNNTRELTKEIIEPYILDIYKREGLRKNPQRMNMNKKR
jgi:AAA+ superfamily predicted ATPase